MIRSVSLFKLKFRKKNLIQERERADGCIEVCLPLLVTAALVVVLVDLVALTVSNAD